MPTILDGGGVRVGSVPAYVDINSHDDKDVIIVGRSGSGKTTFAKNLLRGLLAKDAPVIACIIDPAAEYMEAMSGGGMFRVDVDMAKLLDSSMGQKADYGVTGRVEMSPDIAEIAARHPRYAFHITAQHPHARAKQVAAVFNYMGGLPPETRKIIVVDDAGPDNLPASMAGLENATLVITAQYLTWSEWLLEYAKKVGTRVALGGSDGWSGETLDALRITKADLEGLDRHKALVAVGDNKAIVEVPG